MKINAHVPTQQYGFIELTDLPDDPVEVEKAYNRYAETPIKLKSGKRKEVECFVGGSIFYDDDTHTYTNEKGEVYMSGSQYAKSLEKPFELDKVSEAIARKFNADAQAIRDMWKLKGDISSGFGTAIHAALEMYGKYDGLAQSIDKNTALHDHPVIKSAVQSFYAPRMAEKAEYEVMIVDHKAKRAGQIDRLLITGDKKCRIQDYKTNADITNKLESYWVQLKFYAEILEANGWKVEGLDIFHWAGEWKEYSK